MKRFKIGFAAIIAILAISVTVASHAGAFKQTKAAPAVADCHIQIEAIKADCTAPLTLTRNVTDCSPALPYNLQYAKNPSIAVIDPLLSVPNGCQPGGSKFCCARVSPISEVCTGYPFQITEIFCKVP